MKVRVEFDGSSYTIYNADTGERIGEAANDLNLRLQCRAKGWILTNPPKRQWRGKYT